MANEVTGATRRRRGRLHAVRLAIGTLPCSSGRCSHVIQEGTIFIADREDTAASYCTIRCAAIGLGVEQPPERRDGIDRRLQVRREFGERQEADDRRQEEDRRGH